MPNVGGCFFSLLAENDCIYAKLRIYRIWIYPSCLTYFYYLAANFYLYSSYSMVLCSFFYFPNICNIQFFLYQRLDLYYAHKTIPSTSYLREILAWGVVYFDPLRSSYQKVWVKDSNSGWYWEIITHKKCFAYLVIQMSSLYFVPSLQRDKILPVLRSVTPKGHYPPSTPYHSPSSSCLRHNGLTPCISDFFWFRGFFLGVNPRWCILQIY